MDTQSYGEPKRSLLENITNIVLLAACSLAPLFFVPLISVPLSVGRTAFLTLLVVVSLIIWSISRLKDGVFVIPRTRLYWPLLAFLVSYILSAFFSANTQMSLSGQAYELGTAGSILVFTFVTILISFLFRREKDISRFFMFFIVSSLVVALHQAIRLFFGAEVLSFGLLSTKADNIIGRWNDLAIFFGAVGLVSAIFIDKATSSRVFKIITYIALVVSLLILNIVNFLTAWIILAVLSLVLVVFALTRGNSENNRKIPLVTTVVLVVSIVAAIFGGPVSAMFSKAFNISHVEVRPSWQATLEIAGKTIVKDPVFGVGPNRFSTEWLRNKPAGINSTLFWSVDFNQGIGFVPSLISSVGLLGFISLLTFLGFMLFSGLKSMFVVGSKNSQAQNLIIPSFIASVFLWTSAVVYVPSYAVIFLTFAMSGIFISALCLSGVISEFRISTVNSQMKGFFAVLLLIVIILGATVFGYSTVQKSIAATDFQAGVIAINRDGNLDVGEKLIAKAISLDSFDLYQRFMSDLYLVRVNNILNDKTLEKTVAAQKFQASLGVAIQSARNAVATDPTDYQNFISLGRTYESVVPLGIEGSYENAKKAYGQAAVLNPSGPQIHLFLARLELSHGDRTAARKEIEKTLALKGDYAEAIFLLSQIEIAEGRLSEALKAVEAVAILSPNDPGVFFQLGLLRYNERDWKGASGAFNRAVEISPVYANAKYFLGLSLFQTGNKDEAVKQFEDLKASNPDNQEVARILENLKANKQPFAGTTDSKPEARKTLPVKEVGGVQ